MYSVSLKTVFFMGSSYQNGLFLINVSKWPQCFKMEDLSDFLGKFDLKLYLKAKIIYFINIYVHVLKFPILFLD